MFRSLLALFKRHQPRPEMVNFAIVGWDEVPESPDAPDEWAVVKGHEMPDWAWNALVRHDLVPVPEPEMGQLDWGGDGVKVVKTGQFFPLGTVMHRSALSF